MAKYRKKSAALEAITFDELVAHGKASGGNMVGGMPWSFRYAGHPVTHENDSCYIIWSGGMEVRMTPADVLVTSSAGELFACKAADFLKAYELAE